MTSLDQLIPDLLAASSAVTAPLATHSGGRPAIFRTEAPANTSKLWDDPRRQTPRLVWDYSQQANPARQATGTAWVDVEVPDDGTALPIDLANAAKAALDGVTVAPSGGPNTMLRWAITEPYREQQPQGKPFRGLSVQFDLGGWPAQVYDAPTALQALIDWTVAHLPGVQVNPTSWAPTATTPAIYWSLDTQPRITRLNTEVRLEGTFVGRVLAPDVSTRQQLAARLAAQLGQVIRLPLGTGRFLLLSGLDALRTEVNLGADPFTDGQLRVDGRWAAPIVGLSAPLPPEDTSAPYIEVIHGALVTAATGLVSPFQPGLAPTYAFDVPAAPTAGPVVVQAITPGAFIAPTQVLPETVTEVTLGVNPAAPPYPVLEATP